MDTFPKDISSMQNGKQNLELKPLFNCSNSVNFIPYYSYL